MEKIFASLTIIFSFQGNNAQKDKKGGRKKKENLTAHQFFSFTKKNIRSGSTEERYETLKWRKKKSVNRSIDIPKTATLISSNGPKMFEGTTEKFVVEKR